MDETLKSMSATPHERYAAYLAAYSESRFFNGRRQRMQDGVNFTEGVFQQTTKWWSNPKDIPTATREFLQAFRDRKAEQQFKSTVAQIYKVQQWNAPDPSLDMPGFIRSAETANYVDAEIEIIRKKMGEDPLYFTHNPDGIKE